MPDFLHYYGAYCLCFLVITIGFYGMLMKRNYIKKLIGMTIFQASIILFFIIAGYKDGAAVPVFDSKSATADPIAADYINPLPHALMLTAIVVGVATVGVGLALLIRIYRGFGTLDEKDLQKEFSA